MNLKKSDLTRRQRQAEPSPLTVPGGHYRRGAFSAFAADVLPIDDHDRNIAALKQSDLSLAVGGDRHRLGNAIELEIAPSFLLRNDGGGRLRSGHDNTPAQGPPPPRWRRGRSRTRRWRVRVH